MQLMQLYKNQTSNSVGEEQGTISWSPSQTKGIFQNSNISKLNDKDNMWLEHVNG